jgi:hypothetical protein
MVPAAVRGCRTNRNTGHANPCKACSTRDNTLIAASGLMSCPFDTPSQSSLRPQLSQNGRIYSRNHAFHAPLHEVALARHSTGFPRNCCFCATTASLSPQHSTNGVCTCHHRLSPVSSITSTVCVDFVLPIPCVIEPTARCAGATAEIPSDLSRGIPWLGTRTLEAVTVPAAGVVVRSAFQIGIHKRKHRDVSKRRQVQCTWRHRLEHRLH